MKNRKFDSVDELLERAFLGVIKKKGLFSEKALKELFEEIGIFIEGDESTCWECKGKGLLRDLEKKGLIASGNLTIKGAGISEEKIYALTSKGQEMFVSSSGKRIKGPNNEDEE